ncbi:MAG: hypothetical protein JO036_06995 [Candidatus Eremiobacteraeota bacterium]|nr:hypothetical protein [Candidatus Eremiobacteraeota bacterium]
MKRTPPWVFVAAVGVQLAALGLCLLAMEWHLHVHDEEEAPDEPAAPAPSEPEPEARREALSPAPAPAVSEIAFAYRPPAPPREPVPAPAHEPAPPPNRDYEPAPVPAPPMAADREEPQLRRPIVRAVESSSAPRFGPPPERVAEEGDAPRFIMEAADATTQIVRGSAGEGSLAFGFYPDGNIRFVDVDGGRYAGKAESARARMREIDGMRAFTVQIGVGSDQRLQATFTGGTHDAETIALEPLVGWSVA